MKWKKQAWRQDDGSIDLMQLFVGLLIISVASIGTFQALFYGYEQLDYQMRYRKAVSTARSYMEYWQGRVHTDLKFNNMQVMHGNLARPETFLLDERDPTTDYDDIYCEVAYGPITPRVLNSEEENYGSDVSYYYDLYVRVEWYEPNDYNGPARKIEFDGAMVPADM